MSKATKRNTTAAPAGSGGFISKLAPYRTDLVWVAALAVLSVLIWCGAYNRWSPETWSIPIFYPHLPQQGEDTFNQSMDMARSDVVLQFALIKAARDGLIRPVLPTNMPELGAPHVANWDDYPFTEKAIYIMLGIVARFAGIFGAANFGSLIEDVLAALSFYAVCRLLNGARIWAFAGALVFAFSRFGFAHMIHHIPTAFVWHVPLCILVFHWLAGSGGIRFRTPRFTCAVIIAFVTGIQNPYNTNMFAQLVLIGGLVAWWRTHDWRQWRVCLPVAPIIGAAAVAFLFANSNTFLYHLQNGGNSGAVVRSYKWLELYSLKLVDMIMPPPDHRFGPFALWGKMHMSDIVLQPGELPPTAYLGIVCLAAIVWLVVASLRRAAEGGRIPVEAWLVLWIYLYSDVGGLNGFVGTLGFQLFRATTRFSIWILCVGLMYGVRRFSAIDFKGWVAREFGESPLADWAPYCIAAGLVVFALLDQVPPVPSAEDLQTLASAVDSDRDFAQNMERNLPPKAMVFQLPAMLFPESPIPNVGSYDNLRPYLFSRTLHYSFGTDKGRGSELWQLRVTQSPQLVRKLEQYGFAALYVNPYAFRDGGQAQAFLQNMRSNGYDVIESKKHDLFCVFLRPSPNPISPDSDPSLPALPSAMSEGQ